MRKSEERRTQIGFILAVLIVAVIAGISIRATRKLIENNREVHHSEAVLAELNSTLSTLVDAETGQRGYVITGDEQFLNPYEDAVNEIQGHVAHLQRLAEDNPAQQIQIPLLARKIKEKMDHHRDVIEARKTLGFQAASALIESRKGLLEMDSLRRMIAGLSNSEIELLRVRTDTSERTASIAMVTMFALALLTVVLLGIAHSMMRRDLSERMRAEREMSAQNSTARALAESFTLRTAAPKILQAVGESQGWDFGAFWAIDPKTNVMQLADAWHSSQSLFQAFDEASHQTTMARGVGLPGRVWVSGQPLWIFDVTRDQNFPRASAAAKDGLRTALGFPITLGSKVLGVLEFFSRAFRERDELVLKSASAIGSQMGQFLDRIRGEEDLKEANEKLSIWVQHLERRRREITLLSQLGNGLQSCLTFAEAYRVLAKYWLDLFPDTSGGLFVIASTRTMVGAVAEWGSSPVAGQVFELDDCWALRTGQPNYFDSPSAATVCRHIQPQEETCYLCIPMMAQGEGLGTLHLSWAHETTSRWEVSSPEEVKTSRLQFASAVAENIALALANLRLRDTLRRQSIRDPLTGLFNRRYLEESLPRELLRAARNRRPMGIIMIDIDYFKRYNDNFGHDAGDAVLRELGKYLQSNVRGEDIACRYGGEEFALIMPEAVLDIAQKRAGKICDGAKNLDIVHEGKPLGTITLSIGVAAFPDHGATPIALLGAADRALYSAKAGGRNQVMVWKPVEETA